MTKFFLLYLKEKDQYIIKTMGLGIRFQVVRRKEDMSDEQFKEEAVRQFDNMILQDKVLDAEIIKTEYIF